MNSGMSAFWLLAVAIPVLAALVLFRPLLRRGGPLLGLGLALLLLLPVTTLLLALTAVPLARSRPRESRFRIFLAAIALYVGVFSLAAMARTWVEQDTIGSVPGLWSSHLVLALVLLALVKLRV